MPTAYEIFEKQYIERTPGSKEVFEEGSRYLPGGVVGNGAFRRPYPIYLKEARGAYIYDVDGNEYIDLLIGGGPNILGHCPPAVTEAVHRQVDLGASLMGTTESAIDLARKVAEHMPGMEMMRYANSGSEATHMCFRAARAYTGRPKIAKFEGNFHGQYDNQLIGGTNIHGPDESPEAWPQGAGIPESQLQDTIVLPFNDAESAVSLIKQHAHELAAVIMEPVGGAWLAGVAAEVPFLEAIRRVTEEEGIILIYDEVITGFRLSLSGAVSISGVVPDLRALGKAIGGGLPIGVYGGKREIMDTVVTPASQPHEKDKMYQSGTFTGNPMSTAAGLAMISGLEKPGVYERMNGHGERIRTTLMKMGDELGIELQAVGEGSIFGVFFAGHPIRNIRDVARSNAERGRAFFMGLVANGLYVTPFHLGFTNAAQTDEDIDRVLDISGHVLEEIKAYG